MINLLPQEIKDSRRSTSKLYSVIMSYIVLMVILALAIGSIATYQFILDSHVIDKQAQLAALEISAKTSNQLMSKAALISDRLASESKYRDPTIWSQVLKTIADDTPTDVWLTEIKLDRAADGRGVAVGINGAATSRRAIVLMKDKLNTTDSFSGVEITSVAEKTADSTKSFTFTIQFALSQTKEVAR